MRTVEEIYEALLAAFAERAGYAPEESCDLAVRLYAAAAQLQALAIQADWVLDQSFPQTAEGTYLEYHAAMRGLSRAAAVKAAGTLRFSVRSAAAADLAIPAGSVCMTEDGRRFATAAAGTLAAGTLSADVPAWAVEAGAAGNAVPGAVRLMAECPVGVTACTNPEAFSGGADQEGDEALRARILESYRRLPNGANAAYYEKTAMSHSGVAAAKAVGRARGIGTVNVYLATAAGVPDAALLSAVQEDLSAQREIAVDVQVLAPTTAAVNVSAELTVRGGVAFADVKGAVEAAVRGCFTGKLLGCPVHTAALTNLIYQVPGVENCHLLSPTADVAGADTVLPVLGTLSVTEIGGT